VRLSCSPASPTAHRWLCPQAGGKPSAGHKAAVQQLHDFLCDNVDVLDVGTTTNLLGAYGRLDELLTYAQVRA